MKCLAYPCRDAADITMGTTVSTKWVPCFGARMIIFEWRATNATTLVNAGTPCEATNSDPPTAGGAGTWSATPGNLSGPLPNVTGFALNGPQNGLRCCIMPNAIPFLANRAVRMSVTGGASTTTGVSCVAYVLWDGENEQLAPAGAVAV